MVRSLILPRPHRIGGPLPPNEPLVVAGMFRTGSGLGRAARACYEALSKAGLQPEAVDLSSMMHQTDLPASVPIGRVDPGRPGTLVLFANPPEVERALMGLGLRCWHNWRIIGAWAWELPIAPPEWNRQAQFVSEIWAPSRFVADAFAAAYRRPVHNVPHHIPVAPAAEGPRPSEVLHILVTADGRSSLERKNPACAVRMFRAAFPDDESVRLTLKCRNLSVAPAYMKALQSAAAQDSRITLIDITLTDAEQDALLAAADIILSTHRAEGFGIHLAEAMALGKCVIATGWSGNLEFMSDDAAVLMPFELIPVSDTTCIYTAQPGALWADADFQSGVRALQGLFANPARREEMGRHAQARIRERLGVAAYVEALQSVRPAL